MTALKAWRPQESADPPLTLREAFGQYLRPSLTGRRAAATLRQYETALSHWERFCTSSGESECQRASTVSTRALLSGGKGGLPIGRDDIRQITDPMIDAWASQMLSGGLSPDTINKTWRFLRAILRRVGPRESRNPKGEGLIDRVPAMEPISADDPSDPSAVIFSKAQLEAIYHACDLAIWPRCAPALAWRTWLVLSTCLGARVEDASTFRWSHISLDPTSPATSSGERWEPGFLVWVPAKTKRRKARLILPLPSCCRHHLDQLRAAVPPSDALTIFGWSAGSITQRREQWQEIAAQAGLSGAKRKALRSTCNVLWNRASKSGLGRWVLGHAARDINDAAYMRAEPELIAHADLLDVPECFHGASAARQLFLF